MQQSRQVRADALGRPLVPLASILSAAATSNRRLRTKYKNRTNILWQFPHHSLPASGNLWHMDCQARSVITAFNTRFLFQFLWIFSPCQLLTSRVSFVNVFHNLSQTVCFHSATLVLIIFTLEEKQWVIISSSPPWHSRPYRFFILPCTLILSFLGWQILETLILPLRRGVPLSFLRTPSSCATTDQLHSVLKIQAHHGDGSDDF